MQDTRLAVHHSIIRPMQAIFSVTFPFFALVLVGYLAARHQLLPDTAISGLNSFVLFFALPCLLYQFGASTPFAQLVDLPLMLIYATCALLMVTFTLFISRTRGLGRKDAAFSALVGAFPNTGFMGVPLLTTLLGPRAAGPIIITILLDLFFTSSLCIALAQAPTSTSSVTPAKALYFRAFKGALSNPLPWAIGLGALMSYGQLSFPLPIEKVISMLANAASPVALFAIGALLASTQRSTAVSAGLWNYVPIAAIKLLLHPALVLLIGFLALSLGWPLSRDVVLITTLAAALPSASNVVLLADRHGAEIGGIAKIILVSTVLAFFTFSMWVYLLPVGLRF